LGGSITKNPEGGKTTKDGGIQNPTRHLNELVYIPPSIFTEEDTSVVTGEDEEGTKVEPASNELAALPGTASSS
jgi:hypothetical protein